MHSNPNLFIKSILDIEDNTFDYQLYLKTEMTPQEFDALIVVDKFLGNFQQLLRDDDDMCSLVTEEVVSVDELARVRGILNAFERSNIFKIYHKGE